MNEIIPFGKYKDKPIEFLAKDKDYITWLLSTDWFKDKYSNIYSIVINNFQENSDSPEHNKLQVKFLNQEYRLKVAYAALGSKLFNCNKNKIDEIFSGYFANLIKFYSSKYSDKLEKINRSISYNESCIKNHPNTPVGQSAETDIVENRKKLDSFPSKEEFIASKIETLLQPFNNSSYNTIIFSNIDFENSKSASDVSFSIRIGCIGCHELLETIEDKIHLRGSVSELFNFSIELKPVVYDDFPAILRQMKHSKATYLLINEYRGEGATEEEFVQYFKTQGITVLYEKEILDISLPSYPEEYKFKLPNLYLSEKHVNKEIMWNIPSYGRQWSPQEEKEKLNLIPPNISCEDGKIFSSEKERILLLKMLLEQLGKNKALEIIDETI